MDDLEKLIDFFVETNSLKRTMRYSSCPEKVQESTAGHSWMVAFMVPIIAEKFGLNINVQRAMELANVHDLAEYDLDYDFDSYLIAKGDLNQIDKTQNEGVVMLGIRDKFDFGSRLYDLWKEYEEGKTPEAKFVRALDKLESQLHIIGRGGTGKGADDARYTALYADKTVKNCLELEPFLCAIKKRLKALTESQGLEWKEEYNYPGERDWGDLE